MDGGREVIFGHLPGLGGTTVRVRPVRLRHRSSSWMVGEYNLPHVEA
jgi:hypothetical protein